MRCHCLEIIERKFSICVRKSLGVAMILSPVALYSSSRGGETSVGCYVFGGGVQGGEGEIAAHAVLC